MMDFTGRFTKIKGFSNIRRLPRKDRISLGIKQSAPSFSIKDVEYFIVPKDVEDIYGERPTELDIVFPLSGLDENGLPDLGGIYPQALKLYGSSKGLKCKGDGETAMRANEQGVFEEVDCPCDLFGKKNGCRKVGTLLFFLPKVSMGGVYYIDSGSWNSMVDVQSGIALALEMLRNPYTGEYNSIAMLPFKLRRVFKMVKHGNRQDKHWPLTCELAISLERINQIREGILRTKLSGQVLQIEGDSEELRGEIQATESEKESHSTVIIDKETGEIQEEPTRKKPTKVEIAAGAKKKVEEGKIRVEEIKANIEKKKEQERVLQEREDEDERLAEAGLSAEIVEEPEEEKIINGKEKERILKEAADEFVSVGIVGWKYVSFYACLANVIQPGVSVEKLQDIITQDKLAVDKIIAAKKKREQDNK
jgi:hypothetical protein